MKKKCFVFDLDGTLLDTLETINYYLSKTMTENGYGEVNRDDCRSFVGDGSKILLSRALKSQGEENAEVAERLCRAYVSDYNKDPFYLTRPYPGICEALDELRSRGARLAILSNKPHSSVILIVKKIFGDIFDIIEGASDGKPLKPSPESLYRMLDELSISPSECVFVGDSGVDMQTGKGAGALAVGVLWGYRPESELRQMGADMLISDARALVEID